MPPTRGSDKIPPDSTSVCSSILHPKMSHTLSELESQIDIRSLAEESPIQIQLIHTVKAVFVIHKLELYKPQFSSVISYIKERWQGVCTRQCFYRLSTSGEVITQLEEHFSPEWLPCNNRLCQRLFNATNAYFGLTLKDAWTALLEEYGSPQNVYCSAIMSHFEKSPL